MATNYWVSKRKIYVVMQETVDPTDGISTELISARVSEYEAYLVKAELERLSHYGQRDEEGRVKLYSIQEVILEDLIQT